MSLDEEANEHVNGLVIECMIELICVVIEFGVSLDG